MTPPLEIIQGSRPGPVRASQGHRRDFARVPYKPSQDHTVPPGYRRASGRVPCVLFFKICLRVPDGCRQGPHRTPAGQFTSLIRGLFIAGARITFKLELKVTRGPRGVKKMEGTRTGSQQVPCGTARKW